MFSLPDHSSRRLPQGVPLWLSGCGSGCPACQPPPFNLVRSCAVVPLGQTSLRTVTPALPSPSCPSCRKLGGPGRSFSTLATFAPGFTFLPAIAAAIQSAVSWLAVAILILTHLHAELHINSLAGRLEIARTAEDLSRVVGALKDIVKAFTLSAARAQ